MSLFTGTKALRHQFEKLLTADLAGANDAATAKLWIVFGNWGRLAYIDNTLRDNNDNGTEVQLLVQHPDAPVGDTTYRLPWIEVPGNRVINYSVGNAPGIAFDPGTRIYVYKLAGSIEPTHGALRIATWG